jgi:hypothetical protein
MADGLTRADRAQALQRLEQLRDEIGLISSWLTQANADKAAIILECAERDLGAACWDLEKPERLRPEGWLSSSQAPRPYQA